MINFTAIAEWAERLFARLFPSEIPAGVREWRGMKEDARRLRWSYCEKRWVVKW